MRRSAARSAHPRPPGPCARARSPVGGPRSGSARPPREPSPGTPWNVNITVLQHGRTPLDGLSADDDDPQRRRAPRPSPRSRPASPASTAPRSSFPSAGQWTYEVNDGFITGQPHTFPAVQIGEPAQRPAPRTTTGDDGGPRVSWLAIPGIALLLAAVALLVWRPPRRARTSRRRRESHHPRRRWPRLRGGGDDDRRLRRRRLGSAARAAPPRRRGAGGPGRPHGVDRSRAAASCHTFEPANSTAPIGPDLALSAARQVARLRDGVDRAPERDAAAGYTAGAMPEDFAQRIAPAGPRSARRVPDGGRAVIACRVFDHVTIRVSDPDASERFYDTVLAVLGLEPNRDDDLGSPSGATSRSTPTAARSRSNLHIAFFAAHHDLVDAFHRAGVEAGFTDDGAPGARPAVRRRTTTAASCATPTATASRRSTDARRPHDRRRSTTCGCARTTSRPSRASTRRSAVAGVARRRRPTASSSSRRRASFSFVTRRAADRARPHRLPGVDERAGRRVPRGRDRRRLHETTARPESAPSITPATTGPSCLDPDGHNVEAVNHNR